MTKVKLTKPLKIAGKEVTEVELDVEALSGRDLTLAERESRAMGDNAASMFVSMNFQAIVAAKLLKVPVDDILDLPTADFKKLVVPVMRFFLDMA